MLKYMRKTSEMLIPGVQASFTPFWYKILRVSFELGARPRNKKERNKWNEKGTLTYYFTHARGRHHWADWGHFMHIIRSCKCNQLCKILCSSLDGFLELQAIKLPGLSKETSMALDTFACGAMMPRDSTPYSKHWSYQKSWNISCQFTVRHAPTCNNTRATDFMARTQTR